MRHIWLLVVIACSSADATDPARAKHEDRHERAFASAKWKLAVTVDGAAMTWQPETFARVPKLSGTASDGEARDTWSLREVAHALVGANARVTAVTGDVTKSIAPADWSDASRTPILHTTRRGALKFRWAEANGKWGETDVKDVVKLELSRLR